MKLKKFTLLVGLNDKDTKKQLITIKQAKKIRADKYGNYSFPFV